ncbi:MAG: protein kinase [Thermoanaerobaculia bacterium]
MEYKGKVNKVGDVLGGRYKILKVIGFGGMGVVYQAEDLKLNTIIALKKLRGAYDPQSIERLRQEIILARKVTHENVCRVYDLEEIDGEELISMEFLEGCSIKDILIRKGPFPIGSSIKIIKQILQGLEAAHKTGVIHCDLKPENIFLSPEEVVKIMDFGISRLKDQPIDPNAPIMGTPEFLAPEQIRNEKLDGRCDLYALGIIIYEMLTGKVPFEDPDIYKLLDKILYEAPAPPSSLREDIPEDLSNIILRAIEKDLKKRYQNAREFLNALEIFEGKWVDKILKELSFEHQKMVKLLAVLEAQKALSSSPDLDRLLETLLGVATREAGAERGTIFLVDKKRQCLWSKTLEGDREVKIEVPLGKGIVGHTALTGDILNIPDAYSDPRFNPEVDKKTGYKTKSLLSVPMKSYTNEIVGVIQLLNKNKEGVLEAFNKEDEEFLKEVCAHAATLLEQAQIKEEQFQKMQLKKEMDIALQLKKKLFPENFLTFNNIFISYLQLSEGIIGGTSLEALPVDEDRIFILLSDSSKAGLSSAILSANFQGAFRLLIEEIDDTLTLVTKLNTHICKISSEGLYISSIFSLFDLKERKMDYVIAGHINPFKVSPEGKITFLESDGIPLGLEQEYPYKNEIISFGKGDIFCFFTPWIVEGENRMGKCFGIEKLQRIIIENRNKRIKDILKIFEEEWKKFNVVEEKDATLLLIQVL